MLLFCDTFQREITANCIHCILSVKNGLQFLQKNSLKSTQGSKFKNMISVLCLMFSMHLDKIKKKRSVMKICDTLNPFSFYMYILLLITVKSVSVESCHQWLECYCVQIWNPRFGCETYVYSLQQCFLLC